VKEQIERNPKEERDEFILKPLFLLDSPKVE